MKNYTQKSILFSWCMSELGIVYVRTRYFFRSCMSKLGNVYVKTRYFLSFVCGKLFKIEFCLWKTLSKNVKNPLVYVRTR